jgi:hypothetical protein
MNKLAFCRMKTVLGSTVLFLLALIGMATPMYADEGISVACYAGNASWSLGTALVFDVTIGAQVCNSMYVDCRGRCVGCFHDNDYVRDVCVDAGGSLFFR